MKYVELFGTDISSDIAEIREKLAQNPQTVFVYSGEGTLYDYIDALSPKKNGLNNVELYQFKICYERKDLKLTYTSRNGQYTCSIDSMGRLINELDGQNNCRIIVEDDDRLQLSFIVQQLIYIEYPLETVDILLRKEERDADKTQRFMQNVNELMQNCSDAYARLQQMLYDAECEPDSPTKADRIKDMTNALKSCCDIQKQIQKALDVKLKLAVAASKKAGKSMIVNCFLGKEIAPTSTELATPNNCIYTKSMDGLYHLQLEGGPVRDFKTSEEVYDVIDKEFHKAQNDPATRFSLPDMHIKYVTQENNFSSYTIYDTAGPDAAGTNHAKAAHEAMQKCDVAVFAIDYAKYLTDSEEKYLHEIKELFASQHKFHSLIFALNKIDVRYTDVKATKSFIKSVDFLKTRLASIDDAYQDCIIFPTCSLEYFYALEAEQAGVTELSAEHPITTDQMKKLQFERCDVAALNWLYNHAGFLEYCHGIQAFSYDVFHKDSGMPALMNYVSYVARSKARDEIVNNITFEIAAQQTRMQSVLNTISNLNALINADDKKIGEITSIIHNYADTVDSILHSGFQPEELDCLDKNALLRQCGGNYERLMEHQKSALEPYADQRSLIESTYVSATNLIWDRMFDQKDLTETEIDSLFTASDFTRLVKKAARTFIEQAVSATSAQIDKVCDEIQQISKRRQEQLAHASDVCRVELEKENISIELPTLPPFEFSPPDLCRTNSALTSPASTSTCPRSLTRCLQPPSGATWVSGYCLCLDWPATATIPKG